MPIQVQSVSVLSNAAPGFGSPQISMDFTQVAILARQLAGNGSVRANIERACVRAIDSGSRRVLARLKANVNINDSHIGKFGKYVKQGSKKSGSGGYFHPYSRDNPNGSVGHDFRLVHRLTQNMNKSADIFGPIQEPDKIFADIGWDSTIDGEYIKYVVTGTTKMVPRDVLGLTIEQTQQDVVQIFLREFGLLDIFAAGPGTVSFGGFSSGFETVLSMI